MAALFYAREHEETAIPITEVMRDGQIDIFPEIQDQKYFEVRFRGRRLIITAGKYVGFIPLNERAIIYVEPKIPAANLLRLLAVAGKVVALGRERDYRLSNSTAPPLLEAMATVFLAYLEEMEIAGLCKTYLGMVEAQSILRGQIRFHESLQGYWSKGKQHIAVSSYFDLSADVPANQLLYFTCRSLISHFVTLGVSPVALTRLAQFEELFSRAGVSLRLPVANEIEEAGLSLPHIRALRLASALLAGKGIELPLGGSDLYMPSFLIDMESLFEEYVVRVLAQYLPQFRIAEAREGKKPLFDNVPQPTAAPDLVMFSQTSAIAVGDVKYKIRHTREDLNQVISYALSYGVGIAVLFLPALIAEVAGLRKLGDIRKIAIYEYRLWLASDDLSAEALQMAARLSALLPACNEAA